MRLVQSDAAVAAMGTVSSRPQSKVSAGNGTVATRRPRSARHPSASADVETPGEVSVSTHRIRVESHWRATLLGHHRQGRAARIVLGGAHRSPITLGQPPLADRSPERANSFPGIGRAWVCRRPCRAPLRDPPLAARSETEAQLRARPRYAGDLGLMRRSASVLMVPTSPGQPRGAVHHQRCCGLSIPSRAW